MDCYLKDVFDKFEQIKNTSARTGKESLLRQYENDEMFKMTLKFLLDPYIVTNVGAAKLKKFSSTPIILDGFKECMEFLTDDVTNVGAARLKKFSSPSIELNGFKEYIEFLINKADGKQSTVNIIMGYINKQDDVYEDFLKDLATKSYKMGLSSKTVNKIYGDGFIPEFNVMLAHPYDEKDLRCRFIVTSKLNGCRLICVVENGEPLFFTRQGKPMEDMIQLEREMSRYEDGVYDGEVLAIGDFVDSDAQYKETIKRSRVKGVKTGLKFVMYDFIELDEFKKGVSTIPCEERKEHLKELVENYGMSYSEYLNPLYIGHNSSILKPLCERLTLNGEEGIMINKADGKYQFKRTNEILKYKLFHEGDVLVTDIIEGDGKLKGTLGALKVIYMIDGKTYTSKVGSGFTDKDRDYYWNNKDEILNKIIVVKYKVVLPPSEDGNRGLLFPVYQGIIRDDKTSLDDTNIE